MSWLAHPPRSSTPPLSISRIGISLTWSVCGGGLWLGSRNLVPRLRRFCDYERESPHRKYGAGLLHPAGPLAAPSPDQAAVQATDTIGAEADPDTTAADAQQDDLTDEGAEPEETAAVPDSTIASDASDDFEVTSPDIRHPSTMGISFCAQLDNDGRLVIRLPQSRRFAWQLGDAQEIALNGRYESCTRRWTDQNGNPKDAPAWRRQPAMPPGAEVVVDQGELVSGRKLQKPVAMPEGSPISLLVEVFPRQLQDRQGAWLLTVVLRNSTATSGTQEPRESVLYQTYFEVSAQAGRLDKYPESRRPFGQLDDEEQSLALLYRESATWAIGHGCAAGWDAEPGGTPSFIYADVLPAVQLPSMTPDIEDAQGQRIQLSMRALAALPDDGQGPAWQSLQNLAAEYAAWIQRGRNEALSLTSHLRAVAAESERGFSWRSMRSV